jgi:hypothetical protein
MGRAIYDAARHPAGWGNAQLRTVGLANGATATAQLQVADTASYGCTVTAAGLRVYPPNQFTSKVVPYPLGACARTGPVRMHAGPVQKDFGRRLRRWPCVAGFRAARAAAYTWCIWAWRGSWLTSWSQVGQYQQASMGVPQAR